jgi:immune inhibitor A
LSHLRKLLVAMTSAALLASLAVPAGAARPKDLQEDPARAPISDNLPNPLAEKQSALKTNAQEAVLRGEARAIGANNVVKLPGGQFVELARTGEDSILTILGEFGDGEATHEHDDEDVTHTGPAGPLHNEIAEPDRDEDNTTIWTEDFSRDYYMDVLFSEEPGAVSMRNMYIEMSSGRYAVNGDVTDWAQVPNNAASYGADYCGSIVCQDTWLFVQDSANAWADSFASTDDLNAYLAQFDVWDRYDHDGDGDFNEPDGYIDHFQSVHAGEGQETGGGAQGSDAIWSHRWYVQTTCIGCGGPTVGGEVVPFGGTQIGESDYWIGDYTIEPENGGVGVFAHEYAHDLGLPDLYDTSGNTGGAENSTAFWTLMSSGSYGSSGIPADGIGSKPMHMGNWEKFQLGWLDYEVAFAGQTSVHQLGTAAHQTKKAQGAFVVLPNKVVPLELGDPCEGCGTSYFYSGSDDDLNVTMTKGIAAVPVASEALTAKVRYDIEFDWDYAFLESSSDGGDTWDPVLTSESQTDSDGQSNFNLSRTGITGDSGDMWVDLTATIPGDANAIRFRYQTDGAVAEPGFQVDNIAIDGTMIGTAEEDEGWVFDGFRITTGSETQSFFNAYVLEYRTYWGFDESLQTGPYNFGFLNTLGNWVEHFEYQDGLLISYWDNSFGDNSVGDHPGGGLVLPIDAHPDMEHWGDGTLMRPRLLSRDSTFGLEGVPSITLHNNGDPVTLPSKPAVSIFDDSRTYWYDCDEHACTGDHSGHYQPGWSSVDVPNTGTRIKVIGVSGNKAFMTIRVN